MFLESFFTSRLSNLFTVCSYGFFYFCTISWDFSIFILLIWVSFLLGESDHRSVSCVYPLKEPALGLIDFFSYCFLISVLFISSLISIISFLLLTLGFACFSFPSHFQRQVRLLETSLVKTCITVNFPLRTFTAPVDFVWCVFIVVCLGYFFLITFLISPLTH